jgi:serine/threonine-protein kinase
MVRWMEQVCRIVHVAHQLKIVHQDLRPENIFLTADGSLKIHEFGQPRPPDEMEDTSTSKLLNLWCYKAPEQIAMEAVPVRVSSNVYALGVILYEMLTGQRPFKLRNILSAADQLRSERPVRPSELQPLLPAALDTICLRCLDKAPAQRYASAASLGDDLRDFLNRP